MAWFGLYSFFFSSRRRHTRCLSDWSSDVCSSDLFQALVTRERQSLLHPIRIVQVACLHTDPGYLIHVSGPDTLKRGADPRLPPADLLALVPPQVVREDADRKSVV